MLLPGDFLGSYPPRYSLQLHVPQVMDFTHPQDLPIKTYKAEPPYAEAHIRLHKIGPTSFDEDAYILSVPHSKPEEIENKNGDGGPLTKMQMSYLLSIG